MALDKFKFSFHIFLKLYSQIFNFQQSFPKFFVMLTNGVYVLLRPGLNCIKNKPFYLRRVLSSRSGFDINNYVQHLLGNNSFLNICHFNFSLALD